MAFTLPDLPYAHDALAALGMSKETLEFHHDLHHKAYVDNGNKLIAGTEWEAKSLEEVVKGTYAAGAVAQSGLFNNASQHWNHNLFWEVMGPGGKVMPGALEAAIVDSFGSVAKFKEDFAAAGAGQFGSGTQGLGLGAVEFFTRNHIGFKQGFGTLHVAAVELFFGTCFQISQLRA
jgi:Fe-Mn family superoxide dismutase